MRPSKLLQFRRRNEYNHCKNKHCRVRIGRRYYFCRSCRLMYGKGMFYGGLIIGIIGGALKLFHVL